MGVRFKAQTQQKLFKTSLLKEITQKEKLIQSWNFDEEYCPKSFWRRHLEDKKHI